MPGIRTERFAEPTSLLLGLAEMRRRGVTPRGLLFLALDSTGSIHVGVPEAVDDAGRTELGRAAGPGRAQAHGGQERHQRLRYVRQVTDHPVSWPDAQTA